MEPKSIPKDAPPADDRTKEIRDSRMGYFSGALNWGGCRFRGDRVKPTLGGWGRLHGSSFCSDSTSASASMGAGIVLENSRSHLRRTYGRSDRCDPGTIASAIWNSKAPADSSRSYRVRFHSEHVEENKGSAHLAH